MPSLSRKEAELRAKYNEVKKPSATLERLLDDSTQSAALYYVLNRQVQHICSHSSNWDDGEVTIYDKALIRMYEEGLPLQNIGLLELFLTEYMGLSLCRSVEEEEATVTAFLAAAHRIPHRASRNTEQTLRANSSGEITQGVNDSLQPTATIEDKVQGNLKEMQIPRNGNGVKDDKQLSPREALFENLLQVYQAAKADYYLGDSNKSGISTKKTDKFSNVRFLRDSSENLLRWMKSEGYDNHPLLAEIQKVSEASCIHAEHLAGCKRNYEQREKGTRPHRHTHKRRRGERVVDSYRPDK